MRTKGRFAAEASRFTGEAVDSALTTRQNTTLLLEIIETERRERAGLMEPSSILMMLVDLGDMVDNMRLNSDLLNDRLNDFFHVVVDLRWSTLALSSNFGGKNLHVPLFGPQCSHGIRWSLPQPIRHGTWPPLREA